MGSRIGDGRRPISELALLVSVVVLLSAAMANGIRTGAADAGAPSSAVTATRAAVETTAPPVATAATTATTSEKVPLDDPFRESNRKVPNGPDPIHNRRARWGEAPARRV
ncbi:hypothetical protein ACP4OV_007779 [Aristida adscensionis]